MIEYRIAQKSDVPMLIEIRKKQLEELGQKPCNIQAELMEFFNRRIRDKSMVEYLAVETPDDAPVEENEVPQSLVPEVLKTEPKTEGKIVATAAIVFYDFPPTYENRTGMRGIVANLYVDPNYYSFELTGKLLDMTIRAARERGCTTIWTSAATEGQLALFSAIGFEEAATSMELNPKEWKPGSYDKLIELDDQTKHHFDVILKTPGI